MTGKIEMLVHEKGVEPRLVTAALPDTSRDVLLHIKGNAVLVRSAAQWGLQ